jgi:hypothetical protein
MSGSKRVCCPQKCVQHLLKTCCQMDKTMQEKLGQVHVKCQRSNCNIQLVYTMFLFFQLSAGCWTLGCFLSAGSSLCATFLSWKNVRKHWKSVLHCSGRFCIQRPQVWAKCESELLIFFLIEKVFAPGLCMSPSTYADKNFCHLVALCVKFGIFLLASKVEVVVLRQLVCKFPSFLTLVFYWTRTIPSLPP